MTRLNPPVPVCSWRVPLPSLPVGRMVTQAISDGIASVADMTPTHYVSIITSGRYVVHRSNQGGAMDVKCSHDPGTASRMSCVCSETWLRGSGWVNLRAAGIGDSRNTPSVLDEHVPDATSRGDERDGMLPRMVDCLQCILKTPIWAR